MSVVAHKHYLADKKPFYNHFQPRAITITAVRSVAIQGLMVFNGFVASLDLDEEDDEDSSTEDDDDDDDLSKLKKKANSSKKKGDKKEEFVPPSANDFGLACLTSFLKSLSITTCIRSLEEVAIMYLRPQLVGKLVKDLSKAATRKYARTHSRLTASFLMIKTGMRGNVLGHVSIFLVEEAHQAILILYRRYKKTSGTKQLRDADGKKKNKEDKEDEDEEKATKTFLEITVKNASRSTLAVFTGGIGAAVGTFVRPGLGTVIGATLGDTIAYMV